MRRFILLAIVLVGFFTAHSTATGQSLADTASFQIFPNPAADESIFIVYLPQGDGDFKIVAYDPV